MVFNSFTFLAFLAVVLAVYYLPLSWRWRKAHLLVSSYAFYAAWNPPFVLLLWISTVADWYVGRYLARARSRRARRWLLGLSLCVNLGMLGFFKYGNFLLENFINIASLCGIRFAPVELDILLPVGISFYTFQTLSYSIDIYRREAEPWPSALDYALYVTFFPQLVAGPIVRSSEFLPQCLERRRVTASELSWGLYLLLVGLFQKVVLADGALAPVVESVYDAGGAPDFVSAWVGTLAFAGQIFLDFSGYSTCAIGVAICLGFRLRDNFRSPYAAVGFSDFWRRWHISLSSWLRDYVYIPLGGNRRGKTRRYVNLMGTMLIGGLWHGASWTFVFWGALHGTYLVAEQLLIGHLPCSTEAEPSLSTRLYALVTFALVCIAWVYFRAADFGTAFAINGAMLGWVSTGATRLLDVKPIIVTCTIVLALLLVHWELRSSPFESFTARAPQFALAASVTLMVLGLVLFSGEQRAFLYFQF